MMHSKSSAEKTGVWWDMETCQLPQGYDPYQVRQCMESALKDYLPFTISAFGNLKLIPPGVAEPILSTGIFMKHCDNGPTDIVYDMNRWAANNPPPAKIILISDREVLFVVSDLLPLLSARGYTIIRAFLNHPKVPPTYASQLWDWKFLLSAGYDDTNQEATRKEVEKKCGETAWFCDICIKSGHSFAGESFESMTRHFKSVEHKFQELKRMPLALIRDLTNSREEDASSQSKKAITMAKRQPEGLKQVPQKKKASSQPNKTITKVQKQSEAKPSKVTKQSMAIGNTSNRKPFTT